ncbi:Uncharacterized protein DAT39_015379 [Clarias magur]|uniref:Uncharacterized protein n=1 Tax=Clarias magur TaxID=1594786 RepID=A0A8J4UBG3_CLAMG|nr:Uncharacterized protein DAT39_015379 [Clarias magur]
METFKGARPPLTDRLAPPITHWGISVCSQALPKLDLSGSCVHRNIQEDGRDWPGFPDMPLAQKATMKSRKM